MAAKIARTAATPQSLVAAAKSGNFPPVTLLIGSEEYLIKQTTTALLNVIATPETRDFDYAHLRGEVVDGNELWTALTTLPLLAPKRVILFENPAKLDDRALARLAKYIEQPSNSTTLLLVQLVEDRITLDLPLDNITVCEFASVNKNLNRPQWANSYAERFGKKLTREALDYLLSSSSDDIGELASKLDAAILYVGEAKEIDTATMMKVSGVTTTHTIWDLEDAILKGRGGEALSIAKSFLEGGEKLPVLLAYHRRFLLMLWQLSALVRKHSGSELDEKVKALMGRKTFKFNDFKGRIRALGEPRIRLLVEELHGVESVLKGRSGEDGAIRRYYEWLCHISENPAERLEPSRLYRSSVVSQ